MRFAPGGDNAVQLLQGMAFNLQRFIAHHLQLRVAAALLIFGRFASTARSSLVLSPTMTMTAFWPVASE